MFVRVATPGVWVMDRRRTGVYNDKSESARLMDTLSDWAGWELFHVTSDITANLFSDLTDWFSNGAVSSTRFNNLFAS